MTRCSRKESNYTTTKEMPAMINMTNMKGANKEMPAMNRCSRKESNNNTTKEMPAMTRYNRKESNCNTTNTTRQGEERRIKL